VAVGAEGEFPFLRRAEVLRLHRALEGEVFALDDQPLVGQLRVASFDDDVGLLHARAAGGHFIRVLRRDVRPGNVHAFARDGRTFAALGAQRLGRSVELLVQDVKEALHPCLADLLRVVTFRPGEQDVAVGEVKGAGVAVVGVMGGQITDVPAGHIQFQRVAEGLGEKQDALAVVRPVRPLAEPGDLPDVRRQVIGRTVGGVRLQTERQGNRRQ